MPRQSAGLLMYRDCHGRLEVLLAHPGGPFYQKKDEGVWSIPKGEPAPDEELLAAAQREFTEETGLIADGPFTPLAPVTRKPGGKVIHAWACRGDCQDGPVPSNSFQMEWPPKSGRLAEFPEIDRIAFFDLDTARRKIGPTQLPLLDELESRLKSSPRPLAGG